MERARRTRGDAEMVLAEVGDQAAVAVCVVESGAGESGAGGRFDRLQGATGDGAEVGGGEGGMGGGARKGMARDAGGGGELHGVGQRRVSRLALAEDAFEGGAWKPDEVAPGVHVELDGADAVEADGEGERVVTPRGEGEGHLPVAPPVAMAPVVALAVGGTDGSRPEKVDEVIGTGGVFGGTTQDVGERQEERRRLCGGEEAGEEQQGDHTQTVQRHHGDQ